MPAAAALRGKNFGLAGIAVLALLLGGCGSGPLPPLQWIRLPAQSPDMSMVPAEIAAPSATMVWQLMGSVGLPGHLDRDALLVPQGRAGLQPLGSARWAEPLRDAVPRLLRQDLVRQLGAPLWVAPLPPGVVPTHQLRLEIAAFDVAADARSISVQARWTLADAKGTVAPRVFDAAFNTAAAAPDADALAAAHRLALWQLAGRIAQSARSPVP